MSTSHIRIAALLWEHDSPSYVGNTLSFLLLHFPVSAVRFPKYKNSQAVFVSQQTESTNWLLVVYNRTSPGIKLLRDFGLIIQIFSWDTDGSIMECEDFINKRC